MRQEGASLFLRQLEYLVSLAQERHFTRAAQHCNASQPSLSNAIKQLERELGTADRPPTSAIPRIYLRGNANHRMGEAHPRRPRRDASGALGPEEEPVRPAAPRRHADELAHPAVHQPALSRPPSRRPCRGQLPRPRGATGEADQFRPRCRHHLYRPEAARAAGQPAALQGASQPARSGQRRHPGGEEHHLVRGRRDAAVPSVLEHARARHHRFRPSPRSARRRRRRSNRTRSSIWRSTPWAAAASPSFPAISTW